MLIKNIKWDTDGDMEALASLPTEVYTPHFYIRNSTTISKNSSTMFLTGSRTNMAGAISDSRRKPMMEELSNATRCPNEAERKNIMKAEIKFAITKNGPKAFMSTYNDDWTPANDTRLRVYKKDKRSVTPANAYPEGKGYALAINPWVLQDFLEVNGIDAMQPMTIAKGLAPELRDIRYANDSEIVWYEFSTCNTTKRCTNLSRAKNFVRDWVNYDCPTLYRYTTNQKNVIINGFGIALPVFSNVLVDTYDCKFQLDDTLTEKEINALLKHLNPKGAVAEHLNFAKKANEMGQDALWKLREEVKDTCKAINDLLHEPATRDAILKAQTEHQRDAMPMMDCGWLNWFPLEGTEFAEKFNTVRSTGSGPYFLDIDMPIIDQSVNVQSYGGDVVRDLVSKRLGIDIYYVRHLD